MTLLLSPWPWLTVIAVAIMVAFHLFIISTFPLAVPLEWNVLFAYARDLPVPRASRTGTATAICGHVLAVADASRSWPALLFFPVLGNLRPDLVSFLPAMRQYAGNWASATVGVRARAPRRS